MMGHSLNLLVLLALLGADPVEAFPKNSIFHLESQWQSQEAKKINLSHFSGKPFILTMVFLSCDYSCPITVADLKEVERNVRKKSKKKIPIVLVSIDPEKDSPEEMKVYIKKRNLEADQWTIISSDSENIRELAAVLGFSYREDSSMKFAHSMLSWVFDKNGVKRFTREGKKQSVEEMSDSILTLLKEDG